MKIIKTLLVVLVLSNYSYSQNVFLPHIYIADPSAHSWENGLETLWIYASHDAPNANHHAAMADYHVFSIKDFENWIDHERVLSLGDAEWTVGYA